jgi:hypothetical protein
MAGALIAACRGLRSSVFKKRLFDGFGCADLGRNRLKAVDSAAVRINPDMRLLAEVPVLVTELRIASAGSN